MLILSNDNHYGKWLLFGNTFLEAYSFYLLAAWYGELRLYDSFHDSKKEKDLHPLIQGEKQNEDPTFADISDDKGGRPFKITEENEM